MDKPDIHAADEVSDLRLKVESTHAAVVAYGVKL
ncbi:Uncharacterised protein [Mycobacteroides abscessus subsp. abscessus]|nr:Uncharacterised protein [Mycobacteroides abscessus subsp. abscessus]SIJ97542.1 Uncharacterised protein [Mycobacteroides abscessus subsp. abscessus]